MNTIRFQDIGSMDYKQAWDFQEKLFDEMVGLRTGRNTSDESYSGYLLFVEHPHVFTLGKSGQQENLLVNEEYLRAKGASFYRINRGGDITYHGPGQLVGYPIINLEAFGLGVKDYVYSLEETIIRSLKHFGISSGRLTGASGVWIDAEDTQRARKICAIGVRASRGITMHGFAFNVNTQLSFYHMINPCGFTDKGVTSLETELGKSADIELVKQIVKMEFGQVFKTGFAF
ncbi:MAG: lipoyl(octanoyl) transferase LipB [Bacteroidales bacterium]|nr:lipoyl(octanoyl) transferase LipB [Bacteroidales bacterium]